MVGKHKFLEVTVYWGSQEMSNNFIFSNFWKGELDKLVTVANEKGPFFHVYNPDLKAWRMINLNQIAIIHEV